MNKKIETILILVIFTLLGISSANASEYYDELSFDFEYETPSSLKVFTYQCNNSDCSIASNIAGIEYYSGSASVCRDNYVNNGNLVLYENCMQSYELPSNDVDLTQNNNVFIKYPQDSSFGYLTNMYSIQDNYLPKWYRAQTSCSFDVCIYSTPFNNVFERKANAIAEIGQVNIINTDNDLAPVQILVPIEIEQTVCSAYRTATQTYIGTAPSGYDDYSADTRIDITITNENTGTVYHTDSEMVSIEADTCVALAEFYWTPAPSIQNEDIRFSLSTQVVDSQVTNSLIDTYEVIETVYPSNLDGTCWARLEDFTLTNDPNVPLSTSVAQVTQGEVLFATYNVGAYRDESITPMNVEVYGYVDNVQVAYGSLQTPNTGLQSFEHDLSNLISTLSVGSHEIRVEVTPVGTGCSIAETVTHIQNLQILDVDEFEVSFRIFGDNLQPLANANVNLDLVDADDYFATEPVYSVSLSTDSNGYAIFDDVIPGDYTYLVTSPGYFDVSNNIYVGSDLSLEIYMNTGNSAPQLDIPDFTSQVGNSIVVDLRDYVYDFNNNENDLTFNRITVSGDESQFTINQISPFIFSVVSGAVNSIEFSITVTDPFGASDSDNTVFSFTNTTPTTPLTNAFPNVNTFVATPDTGIEALTTTFTISVSDLDGDTLTCEIEFGDSSAPITAPCSTLNGISHTYVNDGIYTARLRVYDGFNTPVNAYEVINVLDSTVIPPCTTCGPTTPPVTPPPITPPTPPPIVPLTLGDVDLIVNDTIEPGQFEFIIVINNETLDQRNVIFRPVIVCNGVENQLKDLGGILPTSAASSVQRDAGFEYTLRLNTNDFELNIPKDELCVLRVYVFDANGTNLVVEETVRFSYAQEASGLLSVRGEGTDVMNFMQTALLSGVNKGFNIVSFNIVNNEDFGKEISLTVMSSHLGLNIGEKEGLPKGSSREVQVPVFIDKNTKPGMYPVRISVYDGEDHHTRYTFIKVK